MRRGHGEAGARAEAGAQGGAAFGYKWIFIGFELTLAEMLGSANTTILNDSHRSGLSSFIIHPSLALLLEI